MRDNIEQGQQHERFVFLLRIWPLFKGRESQRKCLSRDVILLNLCFINISNNSKGRPVAPILSERG